MTLDKNKVGLIVVAPTFYTSLQETRYLLAVEACRNAAKHSIQVRLVDASQSEEVRQGLEDAGEGCVKVFNQNKKGRKGAALREAIEFAHEEPSTQESFIAFQELEKVDMFRHWHPLIEHMRQQDTDISVPRRSDESFRSTYPIEQYHCESFANLYLNSLGERIGMPAIDWTIGPIAFKRHLANHWIDFDGELWDAQLVPLVNAHASGARISSFEIEYFYPSAMKEEEEGSAKWNEKRLMQLNFLKETVGKALLESRGSESIETA